MPLQMLIRKGFARSSCRGREDLVFRLLSPLIPGRCPKRLALAPRISDSVHLVWTKMPSELAIVMPPTSYRACRASHLPNCFDRPPPGSSEAVL